MLGHRQLHTQRVPVAREIGGRGLRRASAHEGARPVAGGLAGPRRLRPAAARVGGKSQHQQGCAGDLFLHGRPECVSRIQASGLNQPAPNQFANCVQHGTIVRGELFDHGRQRDP